MIGYTYILECSNGTFYTGSTKDIVTRYAKHLAGTAANHTKKYPPLQIVYLEEHPKIHLAFYREKQIQGWRREKKLALINNEKHKLHELAKCLNETSHLRKRE